jgi:RNA polymerase sigma-70 factor (ECF subfamily)
MNLCVDRIRKLNRLTGHPVSMEHDIPSHHAATDDPDPEQLTDALTLKNAIEQFTRELGEVQRLVFSLRDLQDLPVEEVSRITGYDTDKIKSNLYHARKYIREKLIKGGYV